MRISDWSSDVCSSDLGAGVCIGAVPALARGDGAAEAVGFGLFDRGGDDGGGGIRGAARQCGDRQWQRRSRDEPGAALGGAGAGGRSEEHTSELQSLMRISYAVFCLKKKKNVR